MKYLLQYADRWYPGGPPGVYVTRAETSLLPPEPWIESATRSNDYLTVTVTPEALEREAVHLAKHPEAFLTVTSGALPPAFPDPLHGAIGPEIEAAIAYAGEDLVRLWLARTPPATPEPTPPAAKEPSPPTAPPRRPVPDQASLARHVLGNPPYAVLYAHAAAAAVLRWAGPPPGDFRPGRLTEPGEFLLLDALSWLPERVATAARRGRPDLFVRHLETLAVLTIDMMSTKPFSPGQVPDGERLWLAVAAKTGLAACLRPLGIHPPERL